MGCGKVRTFPSLQPFSIAACSCFVILHNSVECSVSGGFFSFLPHVTHLGRKGVDKELNSAEACLPLLRTPLDSTGMSDDNNRSFVFFEDTIPRSLESQLPVRVHC